MTDQQQQQQQQQQQDELQPKEDQEDEKQQYRVSTIRILVLHDANSNAKETHAMLQPLDERLYEKHGLELVYINAPLVVISNDEEGDDRKRVWWEMVDHDENKQESENDPTSNYIGLDASLLHLQQIWNSMPFSGILAIGQGAAMASLLPPSSDTLLAGSMDFGIFVFGHALMEEEEALMAHWPCLHVVHESQVTNPSVQRLVHQFPGQIHVSSNRSDDTDSSSQRQQQKTLSKPDVNAIGKFLVRQKKEMQESVSGESLVVQTQLHIVEQEANRIMAQHIADDPPKALMAIIQPSSSNTPVAGCWQGPKRNVAGGGGAPCPSEFVLNREKRQNGPSRHHPSSAAKEEAGV